MSDKDHESLLCRLFTRKQLLEKVPFSYPTILGWMRRGEFPKALRIGEQRVAWREDEVREWIESRPRQELKPQDSGEKGQPEIGGDNER